MRRVRVSPPLVAVVVFVLATGAWLGIFAWRDARAGDAFDFVRWEISTTPNKWLFALGRPFRDEPPTDEAIARYFALPDRDSAEGRRLENVVEAAIEGRIDAVLRSQDIPTLVPLPGALAVFPPVDVELAGSPRVLVVSPRAHIERKETEVLRPDLVAADAVRIEQDVEGHDRSVSAIVVPSGGFSAYPAVVSNRSDYADTVATSAHEWTHHYLALFPLGQAYFGSDDAKTINETVADLVGDEVGRLVVARWPDPAARTAPTASATPTRAGTPTATPTGTPAVDTNRVLRDLRLEVDGLLAQGKVEDAERRMEETRQRLDAAGVHIRRINQAYFAWYGTYAARADATDPLGQQLREIRTHAGSLARFLETVRTATTRADIERLSNGR